MASSRTDGLVALLYRDLSLTWLNSVYKLLLDLRVHFWFQVKLELVPQIFHRINIWAFKGNSQQLTFFLKKALATLRNMLGIIAQARAGSEDLAVFRGWKESEYLPKCCNRGLLVTLSSVPQRCSFLQSHACWCKPKWKPSRYFDVLLPSLPTFNSKSGGTDGGRLTFVAKENVQHILSVYYSPYEFTLFGLVYNAKQLKVLRVLKSPPLFFTWFSNKHALRIWKASFESGGGLHRYFFAPRLR